MCERDKRHDRVDRRGPAVAGYQAPDTRAAAGDHAQIYRWVRHGTGRAAHGQTRGHGPRSAAASAAKPEARPRTAGRGHGGVNDTSKFGDGKGDAEVLDRALVDPARLLSSASTGTP